MASGLRERNEPIGVGEEAPDFALKDQNQEEWRLSEAVERGPVVLSFYPMDFSPVCSTEMRCVNDEFAKWEEKGVEVVGISCDSFFTHKAWADSMNLKQRLLADMHREVCKAYGFYWPDLNVASRGSVLIGKDDGGKMRVKWVQAREVKQALKPEEILQAIG